METAALARSGPASAPAREKRVREEKRERGCVCGVGGVEPAFQPLKKKKKTNKHNNQNSEGGGMSDVTEPSSEADKG